MRTREQAIHEAAVALMECELGLRRGTVEEAARRAWTPTYPGTFEDLCAEIAAIRAADHKTSVAAGLDVPASPAAAEHQRRTA